MSKTPFINEPQNLYEFPLLRRVTGDTLRPGGLKVTASALELCGFSHGAKLLDVGCGAGASLAFLGAQGFLPVGMDASPVLLAEAQSHGPVVLGDAQALPVSSGSFQGVFCECVVSLLDKPDAFFQESYRVLDHDGWLVVSDIVRMPLPFSASSASSSPLSADSALPSTHPCNNQLKTPLEHEKSCLDGAKTRQSMERLFQEHGFVVRHVVDYRRSLVELAAKMVWEFGSMNAFWELWRQNTSTECLGAPCAKQFGYELFIGQKRS